MTVNAREVSLRVNKGVREPADALTFAVTAPMFSVTELSSHDLLIHLCVY